MVSDGHLSQQSDTNISANRIQCPLYNYGCTDLVYYLIFSIDLF